MLDDHACKGSLSILQDRARVHLGNNHKNCLSHRWYDAQSHFNDLNRWATALQGWVDPKYHLLEVFGASKGLQKTWHRAGKSGVSFDIKISKTHDLCTECGVKVLIQMGLQPLVSVATMFIHFHLVLKSCLSMSLLFSSHFIQLPN